MGNVPSDQALSEQMLRQKKEEILFTARLHRLPPAWKKYRKACDTNTNAIGTGNNKHRDECYEAEEALASALLNVFFPSSSADE